MRYARVFQRIWIYLLKQKIWTEGKKNALGFEAIQLVELLGELPHFRSGQKNTCSQSVLRKGCWLRGGIEEGCG